ncbi:MAG: hypothetical protein IPG58_16175 [Acidobacteria bacterium]|nr:hypothetical protein [Acidobacteriota bacterium]
MPLPQADLLELLVALNSSQDGEIKQNAAETLRSQQAADIESTVRSTEAAPSVLQYFATQLDLPVTVHEAVLTNPSTPAPAITSFAARTQNGSLLELISFNQQLLIQNPAIIDAIIGNASRTPEAERRASEIKREFFEKNVVPSRSQTSFGPVAMRRRRNFRIGRIYRRHGIFGNEPGRCSFIAQHIEVPDRETDDSWLSLEYIEEIYEETEEQRKAALNKIIGELQNDEEEVDGERLSMINRIMKMGVKDRVKLGSKATARHAIFSSATRIASYRQRW